MCPSPPYEQVLNMGGKLRGYVGIAGSYIYERLAMAAAEAKSGLPDTLRWATRGRLLLAFTGAPFTARLTPAGPGTPPCTVECRRCGAGAFTGELLVETSRLAAVPFLKLVAGGSGRGRTRACGV
jgi:hypothetical protein